MPSLAAAQALNSTFSAPYTPVALFVGGTSGVGEGAATAFARATKGNAHIIICGRNQANAERIIATFPRTDRSRYEFVQCDVTLMKNVSSATAEIKSKVGALNYLVMSQGMMTMNGFTPTAEGIDRKLALHFYSRWKFVDELMPCLQKAVDEGQESRVMSIFAAGAGGAIDTKDLGLKKTYSLPRAAVQAPTYNDIMVEEYAQRHPSMSFIHIMPGAVNTPLVNGMPWAVRMLSKLAVVFTKSIDDCGELMTSALVAPEYKKGSFHLGQMGDPLPAKSLADLTVGRRELVDHYNREVALQA